MKRFKDGLRLAVTPTLVFDHTHIGTIVWLLIMCAFREVEPYPQPQ